MYLTGALKILKALMNDAALDDSSEALLKDGQRLILLQSHGCRWFTAISFVAVLKLKGSEF